MQITQSIEGILFTRRVTGSESSTHVVFIQGLVTKAALAAR